MILRYDRIAMELPPPSDPDPAGAAAVQELMGGRFGEMSTFMNYTFQSFNFRGRQGARPFYDLVANIAAEEFGHVELVAAAINTMLTGASPSPNGRAAVDPKKGLLSAVKGIGIMLETPVPRRNVARRPPLRTPAVSGLQMRNLTSNERWADATRDPALHT